MNNFTKELVDRLAEKLLIALTEEENKQVLDEFAIIDENLGKLELEGLDAVEPMTHCLDNFSCTLREDVAEESIPVEELLRNSDKIEGREIEVPKVVGE